MTRHLAHASGDLAWTTISRWPRCPATVRTVIFTADPHVRVKEHSAIPGNRRNAAIYELQHTRPAPTKNTAAPRMQSCPASVHGCNKVANLYYCDHWDL